MPWYLGIDTSNYTTSCAAYHSETGALVQRRRLLPVKPGEIGLRQSDALFAHVRQLPGLLEALCAETGQPAAVGYSARPRDEEGSYMPCFLAGELAASTAAGVLGAPKYAFSHQAGHVAAALHSAGLDALWKRPFIAFHVSGGTTEALFVEPDARYGFAIRRLAGSLDLKAGQAVDRVGAMLSLPFPAGPSLERAALQSHKAYAPKPAMKGENCCLSGVENRCARMLAEGEPPCDVARYCLDYLRCTLDAMLRAVLREHPGLPVVFAGGVMSNSILRAHMREQFGAYFAADGFSSDNAAGIAVLAARADGKTSAAGAR